MKSPDSDRYKDASTRGPNGVSNRFLSDLRGQNVIIASREDFHRGRLLAWDSFAFILELSPGREVLIYKEPGMMVQARNGEQK